MTKWLPAPLFLLTLYLFCWSALVQSEVAITLLPLELTDEERRWLERQSQIVLGISDQFLPDVLVHPDGSQSGLVVDYFALLNRQLGGRLQLYVDHDWQAITEKAMRGEIDGLASSAPNARWDQYFLYSEPYYYGYLHIYVRSDSPPARNMADLIGKRVGYLSGMKLVEQINPMCA
ncbi:hypothetical protein D5085_03075 [Ectothiorhodospiraceae bacterium BW-2]|nr:hypothetical protein D5085_03075 [Ectothiorhodospiraceae bacterium BW-2]